MPWDAKSFAAKHNHKLSGEAASKAAAQATKLVESGMKEGEAIAKRLGLQTAATLSELAIDRRLGQ